MSRWWVDAGAGGMLIRPHNGGVDRDVPVDLARGVSLGLQLPEQAFPGAVRRPQSVPFINRLPRTEPFWQVTPLNTGPHPVQNPVDHLPVIPPPAALRTRPQPHRRDLVPPATRLALQRRLLHPRTPRPAHPARPTTHPVPQPSHRRLPRRDRPGHQTRLTNSTTSRVQPQ